MEAIVIYKAGGSWISAHFKNGRPDPYVVDLFDTYEIPTAWTDAAPFYTVRSEMERLNPKSTVFVVHTTPSQ